MLRIFYVALKIDGYSYLLERQTVHSLPSVVLANLISKCMRNNVVSIYVNAVLAAGNIVVQKGVAFATCTQARAGNCKASASRGKNTAQNVRIFMPLYFILRYSWYVKRSNLKKMIIFVINSGFSEE